MRAYRDASRSNSQDLWMKISLGCFLLGGWGVLWGDLAHAGLTAAIAATLPGASWQRCSTHYYCTGTC